MKNNIASLVDRDATELLLLGVSAPSSAHLPPPTEAEIAREFYRPDLDAAQDQRAAEMPDDPHYIEMGVIDA